jgi:hypothetical protein
MIYPDHVHSGTNNPNNFKDSVCSSNPTAILQCIKLSDLVVSEGQGIHTFVPCLVAENRAGVCVIKPVNSELIILLAIDYFLS